MHKKLVILLLVSQLFVSCDKKLYDPTIYTLLDALEFAKDVQYELFFDCSENTSSISFKANYAWLAQVNTDASSWLVITSPYEEGPGNHVLTFEVKANETEAPRDGTITFYAGDKSYEFFVTQSNCK